MRHSISSLAIVLAGGLLVVACGSAKQATGESATGAIASDDPCTVLTKAEITEITSDVVTYTDSNDGTCTYHSDPKDGVQVTVHRTGGADRMSTVRASAKILGGMGGAVSNIGGAGQDVGNMLKADKSAVPALGDEAAWGLNDTLSVRKGEAFVEVSPPTMHDPVTHSGNPLIPDAEKRAIAQSIATKILQKIAP